MSQLVHVAVGVIVDNQGRILIARRAASAHQGGLWEFPGGKVSTGESVQDALARELFEELDIHPQVTEPLLTIHHAYTDKTVVLDVHRVIAFTGIAHGKEGQPIIWVTLNELSDYAFPAANRAIVNALTLPDKYLITGAAISVADYLQRSASALQSGIRMIQLRCPDMPVKEYLQLAFNMQQLCADYDARLILNTSSEIFSQVSAGGLHLNRHQLKNLTARPVDDACLLGASCHNAAEIAKARSIGVDYITLSPVKPTSSHPGANVLGWAQFSQLAAAASMPVFALGGLCDVDIAQARASGAQGIAAISCWWGEE